MAGGSLDLLIRGVRTLTCRSNALFPAWGGQYLRDMSSGLGKLQPLDNDRYDAPPCATARDVLARAA